MHCYWITLGIHSLGEAAVHSMGNHSSLLSCSTRQESEEAEVVYIVTSLLVPTGMAIIPLVTHSYGLSSDGTICYIYANTSVAFIERLALWDAPAMFTLIATSTAMIVMVIKLASQVCRRSKYEPITDGDQFSKALKQLLPLSAFLVLFFIFEIPVFIFHVYTTHVQHQMKGCLLLMLYVPHSGMRLRVQQL